MNLRIKKKYKLYSCCSDDEYLTSAETIEFSFPYESSYALAYKQALYESLRYDVDDYISNKYFCRELWEPVPDNCYSEHLPLQHLRLVVCPYYVTYKCNQCNQCMPNPCQNGGTCTTSNTNNPVCNCAFGWTGNRCQLLDRCHANPCGHANATCFQVPVTANLPTVLTIGSANRLCQEICVCEPVTSTGCSKYFYAEGKYSISTAGLTGTDPVLGPNAFSTPSISGSILIDNADSLTCSNRILGDNVVSPLWANSSISGLSYTEFIGKANLFCPTTKFHVNNCTAPISFIPSWYNFGCDRTRFY